jgi:hypothetical protein
VKLIGKSLFSDDGKFNQTLKGARTFGLFCKRYIRFFLIKQFPFCLRKIYDIMLGYSYVLFVYYLLNDSVVKLGTFLAVFHMVFSKASL